MMRLTGPFRVRRLSAALFSLLLLLNGCASSPSAPPAASTQAVAVLPSVTAAIPTPVPTLAAPTAAAAAPTTPPATATAAVEPTVQVPAGRAARYGQELLFLRNRTLVARSVSGGAERTLADDVLEFAVDASGQRIALVRAAGISLTTRAGGSEQLLVPDVTATDLDWAPDGLSLLFSRSSAGSVRPTDWPSWSLWCAQARVVRYDLSNGRSQELGAGCDATFASDGRRIAFATPPQLKDEGYGFAGVRNQLTLVNRSGANGWAAARAGADNADGLLVYAPAFAPDGTQLAYERFIGYRALVDINLTELRGLNQDAAELLIGGFGWGNRPQFSPDGSRLALVENNWSDPRGVGGYEPWALNLVTLQGERQVALPEGEVRARGDQFQFVARVTAAAWAPDGSALAAQLPAGWQPGLDPYEPMFEQLDSGSLWLFTPDGTPLEQLVDGVDALTSLAWLPADLQVIAADGHLLAAPADWQAVGPLAAAGAGRRIDVLILPAGAQPDAAALGSLFSELNLEAPFELPDGSQLLALRGKTTAGEAVAGTLRVMRQDAATLAAVVYAPAAQWPLWRAQGLALVGLVDQAAIVR